VDDSSLTLVRFLDLSELSCAYGDLAGAFGSVIATKAMTPKFDNRITRMLGVDIPIANAPMGFVVTPALVSAVAEAGAIGMVPGSIGPARAADFIRSVRASTNRPFGANIPVSHADHAVVDTLIEHGVHYITTSTGPVPAFASRIRQSGAKLFHAVNSLDAAKRAADAGVDGLIVEGHEGAGLGGDVAMLVLLPLVTGAIDLPVIAAGGIADGASMAAAFALGAEGVQMGTRMVASAESAVHDNFKQAIVDAAETSTLLMNRHLRRPIRVLRTRTTEAHEFAQEGDAFAALVPDERRLYQDGNMESGFAAVGEVSARIDEVRTAAEIIARTVNEFGAVVDRLAKAHRAP
jgi:enoyl-[acyl-carrier protein] reductase II